MELKSNLTELPRYKHFFINENMDLSKSYNFYSK
jgi:hypothetical protein